MPNEHKSGLPSGLSGRVVRWIVSPGADPRHPDTRARLGELEGFVSMGISILLSVVKFVVGLISGSISLLADAINNLVDIASSLIVALGFRWSRRPRDRGHPFGHGRIEAVATLLLAILLLVVAWKVAWAGVERLMNPKPFAVSSWILITVLSTLAIKAWLARFARSLARATGSVALEADAWNHTYDVACTSLVVAALVSERVGWNSVDGWAGLGVSLLIAYTGLRYGRRAIDTLIGEAPSLDQLRRIRELALSVPGVFSVHEIILHSYGEASMISLHAEVDARQSAIEAHNLAELVEKTIADVWNAKVIVHVDPVDHGHPCYTAAAAVVTKWIAEHPEIVAFHDLRLSGDGESVECSVDLVVRQERLFADFEGMVSQEAREMGRLLPRIQRFDLGIEPEFASDREYRRTFVRRGNEIVPLAGEAHPDRSARTRPVRSPAFAKAN
jgi:cation diffusion facilitator family transporter